MKLNGVVNLFSGLRFGKVEASVVVHRRQCLQSPIGCLLADVCRTGKSFKKVNLGKRLTRLAVHHENFLHLMQV